MSSFDEPLVIQQQLRPLRRSAVLASAGRHHLAQPGKMVRARMAFAVASGLGLEAASATACAVVCESLHNASLVLDDVHDREAERRGQASVWHAFGSTVATNLATSWLNHALRFASSTFGDGAADLVHEAVDRAVCGQSDEAAWAAERAPSVEDYLRVAGDKTGALLGLPVLLPLVVTGADSNRLQALDHALTSFGLAYQIRDDLADLGRPDSPDGDLARGRWTLPAIQFHTLTDDAGRNALRGVLEGAASRSTLVALLTRIFDSSAPALCLREADRHRHSFETAARALPPVVFDAIHEALSPFQSGPTLVGTRDVGTRDSA